MRVRSIAIIEAVELKDFTDESILDVVKWIFLTGGSNVLTEKHGSHMHLRAPGIEFEIYEETLPLWLVYSGGNYFGFTAEEFHKNYEPADKGKLEARVTVQTQKEFVEGAAGTVFQALVNSGLTRDQALDGLIEIQSTGIVFGQKSDLIKKGKKGDLTWENHPSDYSPEWASRSSLITPEDVEWASRCGRCTMEQIAKYGKSHHETSEHDQWYKNQLNKEMNPDA